MNIRVRKLTLAGMLIALAVATSTFAIPIGASKCFPVQHLVNVLAGAFLGPVYSVTMAFCTSLIRNLLGTGTLLAFPGSMVGAFLGAFLYQKSGRLLMAYVGEVIGTGIIGGMLCYPVAAFLLGNSEAALFTYVLPFMISTVGGTIISIVILTTLQKAKVLDTLRETLEDRSGNVVK